MESTTRVIVHEKKKKEKKRGKVGSREIKVYNTMKKLQVEIGKEVYESKNEGMCRCK